ncbi:MAG: phosphotransferase [Deltaproteobacteria bacterium]|nr:phosphotransferase [Deltaproteobacteria bacterium]
MGKEASGVVRPERIQAWLVEHAGPEARLVALAPLGATTQEALKAYGYGRPLQITFERAPGAAPEHLVLRTMSPDPFGHDRRADRIASLVEAYDDFATIPDHVRPIAVGAFDARPGHEGALVPIEGGEPWLVTTYVEGELYAHDLSLAAARAEASPRDLARARRLATWLAALHAEPRPPEDHRRDVRDTIGSGEGLFGIADAWPDDHPLVARLCAYEQAAVAWRWRLRGLGRRARRTHGDLHPFNLLFREGDDFTALDCSRRGAGEPADDVTCLSLNYLFFGLVHGERVHGHARVFAGPMRALWDAFWETYLEASGDRELLSVVAPFFAWRALVVASPVWYPHIADEVRVTLLDFATRLLAGEPFDPARPEPLLEPAP